MKHLSRILKLLPALVSSLVVCHVALAQRTVSPFSSYMHDVWQTKEGLPQNSVSDIVQSPDGYIWFGTQEGLVRFDGVRFLVFDKRNTKNGLLSNFVTSLWVARDSSLWIGTEVGGVSRLKNGVFTVTTIRQGLSENSVRSMAEDQEGAIWCGTSYGLTRVKDGQCSSADSGLTYPWVNTVLIDRNGTVWAGTNGGGLYRSDHGVFSPAPENALCGSVVMSMCQDSAGDLWVGSEKGTLTRLSRTGVRTFTVTGARGTVSAVLRDREGRVWVGTEDGILAQFAEPDSFIYFTRNGGAVTSLFEDREGSLWVGRSSGGLHRLKKGKFITYTTLDGLPSDYVATFCPDRDGAVWVGTMGGLSRFWRDAFTTYPLQDGLQMEGIMALHVDQQGAVWIGGSGGLLRLKDHKVRAFITSQGAFQQTVRGIDEDKTGKLWLATRQGLFVSSQPRHGDPVFVPYRDSAGVLSEPLWGVHISRQGNSIWLATGSSGLIRLSLDGLHSSRTSYTTRDGLSGNVIRSMLESSDGTMWFGTYQAGLTRFKDGRFASYTTANGLFDDNVFSILEDQSGNLWMSCNRGVFRVSKNELNDLSAGKITSLSCVSYGTADGMRTFECNGGAQPSGCRSTDGRLWFATMNGAAVVDPEHLVSNPHPPAVVIERATIDGRDRAFGREVRIEPGNGDLEFTYGALTFVAPEKVKFKYRLVGFDDDWVEANSRRIAYYTNIPPGTYTFRVIACNNDGVWNQTGASFPFTLAPHFYQTAWFYALCVLLIGLLGSIIYHLYRTYKDREQIASRLQAQLAQAELQVLKMQLQPHFLFNTLHAISSLMHKDLDAADEMMARLGEFLRYTLERDGSQEVPLAQELEMIDHYLEIEQIRLGDRLRFRTDVAPGLGAAVVPNLILQPIVENAIRYGIAPRPSGGCLQIVAEKEGDRFRVRVCDDGPGLPERPTEGVGFLNTRSRLQQLYGSNQRFEYGNRPEGGVCVTLEFPLRIESHEIGQPLSRHVS